MESETGMEQINDIELRDDQDSNRHDNNEEKNCCPKMQIGPAIILIALGLSPIVAVLIGLWALDNVIVTFVLFHYVFALGIPLILLWCVQYFKSYRHKVNCLHVIKPNSQASIFFGILIFLVASGGIVFIYYCIASQLDIKAISQKINDFGITKNDTGIIVFFFIYFNIINPLIEEFFWRRFLLQGFPRAESYKLLVSLMYGSYHMFVIAKFTNWGIGVLVAILLVIVGRIFIFFQEWKDGFVNLMAHVGGDLGISLMLLCILYNWPV